MNYDVNEPELPQELKAIGRGPAFWLQGSLYIKTSDGDGGAVDLATGTLFNFDKNTLVIKADVVITDNINEVQYV